MDWFNDHTDTVIGGIVGLLGVLAAVGVAFWERKPKRLDYAIKTNTSILASGAHGVRKLVRVKVANMELENPWLVVVRIKNTGRKAVEAGDYVQAIRIEYSDNDVVASFLADESSLGVNSGPYEDMPADEVMDFAPKLLNAGDWFDIQQLSDGPPGKITVSARIKDQSRPMKKIGERPRYFDAMVAIPLTAIMFLALYIPGAMGGNDLASKGAMLFSFGATLIFVVLAIKWLYRDRSE